jgi:DNA-binding NarL/FixJ family response regulator
MAGMIPSGDHTDISDSTPILTDEERDILILVAVHPGLKHLSNSEISQRLNIPVTKVKTLIHEACRKLNAHNRNEATLLAMRMGEIKLSELISLEELAELLRSVKPDTLRTIAASVRQNQFPKTFPDRGDEISDHYKKRSGLLTNRERDVLSLVSRGLTNEEIAENLCMTTSAVRTFLNRAFLKLGARKRSDAVQLALKKGEIMVEEISSIEELTYYLYPLGADSIEKLAKLVEKKITNPVVSNLH